MRRFSRTNWWSTSTTASADFSAWKKAERSRDFERVSRYRICRRGQDLCAARPVVFGPQIYRLARRDAETPRDRLQPLEKYPREDRDGDQGLCQGTARSVCQPGHQRRLLLTRRPAEMHLFEEDFPYVETEDQLHAIADIKKDMHDTESDGPAHLRRCGLRQDRSGHAGRLQGGIRGGKQVAVLVPTTILALQHYETFSAAHGRLSDPYRPGLPLCPCQT